MYDYHKLYQTPTYSDYTKKTKNKKILKRLKMPNFSVF